MTDSGCGGGNESKSTTPNYRHDVYDTYEVRCALPVCECEWMGGGVYRDARRVCESQLLSYPAASSTATPNFRSRLNTEHLLQLGSIRSKTATVLCRRETQAQASMTNYGLSKRRYSNRLLFLNRRNTVHYLLAKEAIHKSDRRHSSRTTATLRAVYTVCSLMVVR